MKFMAVSGGVSWDMWTAVKSRCTGEKPVSSILAWNSSESERVSVEIHLFIQEIFI